ncbi:MAG: radical SAM protein [Firmicutes bacterium]|nr:radical SAM protein [Bacillota bacterium]
MGYQNHPCFNAEARHRYGRIHLPVAAECNIQCNYCNRKYDCANENRPGVASNLLTPKQAAGYLERVLEKRHDIAVAAIAGPGDPFAKPELTLETVRRVNERFPQLLICLATNGLNLLPYIEELGRIRISHLTITINAVDPEIGKKIYAWVRDGKVIYRGAAGAALLLERQLAAVAALKRQGITVKINTVIIPGINSQYIKDVAAKVAELHADIMNAVPFYPVPGSFFAGLEEPSIGLVSMARREAGRFIPQMEHCVRCRADAAGILGEKDSPAIQKELAEAGRWPLKPSGERPCVAVASREGVLINQHLGEATRLAIYKQKGSQFELIETRPTPPAGGGFLRWRELARTLADCRAILVYSAGESPRKTLQEDGIWVIETEGLISEALPLVYQGIPVPGPIRRKTGCGGGCKGKGTGQDVDDF